MTGTLTITPAIKAEAKARGSTFTVQSVKPARFDGAADPVMSLDHYRMDDVTFKPHPHAGFSAVSYLFEDSAGGLRNRDSLGHDFVIEPGGILWTQAGSGVIHDELPGEPGRQVHGLQIFVNLSAANKATEPRVLLLGASEVPVWTSDAGTRVRVAAGGYGGLKSPLEPSEPFNLFDIALAAGDAITLPLDAGWDMLVYTPEGISTVAAEGGDAMLDTGEAVAVVADKAAGELRLSSAEGARVVVLSGPALGEPVVEYGFFIMNSKEQIDAAYQRYEGGEMGVLEPLS